MANGEPYWYYSYFGDMKPIKINRNRSIGKMSADELLKKILLEGCDKLIEDNANKWHHFERRFITEINKIKEEINYLARKIEKP